MGAGTAPDGRTVHVRGAPPGAVVEVQPFARRRGIVHARRLALEEPPPGGVVPRCAIHGTCGGCVLQEMDLAAQRAARHDLVLRVVGDPGSARIHTPTGTGLAYGYRNRVELTYGSTRWLEAADRDAGVPGQGRFLGFHAAGRFDRVVDVSRCELVPEGLNEVITRARAHLARSALEAWNPRLHQGFWRHLLLRIASGGGRLAAVFTAPPAGPEAEAEVRALGDALPSGTGLAWYVNARPADAATGVLQAVVREPATLEERVGPLRLRLGPTSFFQTSTPGAEVLYATIAALAGGGGRLLDLYCGIGAIGLWLAPSFDEVIGIEAWPAAVDDAGENARRNGIGHIEFRCGPVEDRLPGLTGDVAVVDPPRAGLHPRASAALVTCGVRRVVYVACHPPSLARDRFVLEEGGYRMTDLCTVDLFPQTGHVEVVAAFERATAWPGR